MKPATKETRKQRNELLKQVRSQHDKTVETTRDHLKTHTQTRKQIVDALRDGAQTVPQVAQATGLDGQTVLWHITAMKKYDLVTETDFDGEYYCFALSEKESEK
jgi:predicted transcriptional regulator